MSKSKKGIFLGIPYDWEKPTMAKFKKHLWNPKDKRILTPRVFGWGYTLNFYQLFKKMGFYRIQK